MVARFVQMAHDLDAKAAGGTELRVYWLEHANAETLLPTLQQLIGGGSTWLRAADIGKTVFAASGDFPFSINRLPTI